MAWCGVPAVWRVVGQAALVPGTASTRTPSTTAVPHDVGGLLAQLTDSPLGTIALACPLSSAGTTATKQAQ